MIEQKQMQPFSETTLGKREGALLVICDGAGRIVFIHGDPEVFGLKHSKMIQRNLFSLGFTILSLLEVSKTYPNGVFNYSSDSSIKLSMELINKTYLKEYKSNWNWNNYKNSLIRVLKLTCSIIKVGFSEERIKYGKVDIVKDAMMVGRQGSALQELVLVEIEISNESVKAKQQDYEYSRRLLMDQLKNEEMA